MNNSVYETFDADKMKSTAKWLYTLSPLEFTTIGCVVGILICEKTTFNEQNSLGNFLELVGQVLLTYSAQASAVDPNYISISLNQLNKVKSDLEQQIFQLKKELGKKR